MADAWEQAGAVREANALLRQAQLARELGGVLLERHLQRLSPEELLAGHRPGPRPARDVAEHARRRAARLAPARGRGVRRPPPPREPAEDWCVRRAEPDRRARPARRPRPRSTGWRWRLPRRRPAGMVVRRRPAFAAADRRTRDPRSPRTPCRLGCSTGCAPRSPWSPGRRRASTPRRARGTGPDPLAAVDLGPEFDQPMYDGLRDVAPQLLLPGVDHVPPDTVALLETTPRLIEAYMVGLNHEMSRELLWREFPADLRGHAVPPVLGRRAASRARPRR